MIWLAVFVALSMFAGLEDGVRWYTGRPRGGGRHRCLVNDWLVMQGLEGLDRHLQGSTFPLRTFLDWSVQLLASLEGPNSNRRRSSFDKQQVGGED